MKIAQTMFYIFSLLFSFLINNTLYANDDVNTDIKVIGYTEKGNQWLLTITNKYISTNDPKIFTKEIVTSLKPLVCKNCNYADHAIVCQKNRDLFEGDEVNCRHENAFELDDIRSSAKIKCYGKICRLKVTSRTGRGTQVSRDKVIRNILYEMGDAEFNLADTLIEDKEAKKAKYVLEVYNENASKLQNAKNNCKDLGLEEKTEKFADCVLMFY